MNSIKEIKKILGTHKTELQEKYKVKEIGIFGSYVKGKQKEKSDLDILVEFREVIDFFEFLELEEYLSKTLNLKVDMVMKKALKPNIGRQILNEVTYV